MYKHQTLFSSLLCSMIFLSVSPTNVDGRVVEDWTHDKLQRSADLICICTVTCIQEEKNEGFEVEYAKQLRATVEIKSILKGPDLHVNTISMVHYGLKPAEPGSFTFSGPVNGASFLKLTVSRKNDINSDESDTSPSQFYLMYLRKRKGGVYEPVSGHMDPNFSVWKLSRAEK